MRVHERREAEQLRLLQCVLPSAGGLQDVFGDNLLCWRDWTRDVRQGATLVHALISQQMRLTDRDIMIEVVTFAGRLYSMCNRRLRM